MNDFSAALNNFQAIQRRAAEKEKESVARARAGSRLSVRRRPSLSRGATPARLAEAKHRGPTVMELRRGCRTRVLLGFKI